MKRNNIKVIVIYNFHFYSNHINWYYISMSICANCFSFQSYYSSSRPTIKPITVDGFSSNSYSIQSNNSNTRGSCEKKIDFQHNSFNNTLLERYSWIEITCYLLEKSANENLIVLQIKNTSVRAMRNKHKILYCQNEISDLGISLPFLIDLSTQIKTDVISFDYSGYGKSKGNITIDSMVNDAEQVVDFIIANLNCSINELIIFGDSIGTLGALYISMLPKYSHVKGMILLSTVFTGQETQKISSDSFGEIKCPVLIIYGQKDTEIVQEKSLNIMKKLQHSYQWSPKEGTHFDIPVSCRDKFYITTNDFIEYMNKCERETPFPLSFDNCYYENSINLSSKKVTKVKVIDSFIKLSKSNSRKSESSNSNGLMIHIDGETDNHCEIIVVDDKSPDNKSKKATLQNNLVSSVVQKNIAYKTTFNKRTESNGTFDLFS